MVDGILTEAELRRERERLKQIRILIADGDLRIGKIVKQVLNRFGFENIQMVRDGSEGIDLLRHQPVDLMITDWIMEPMDGISLIRYVRTARESPNPALPIIMLTGHAEKPDVEFARDNGVTEFVVKPFSAKTLGHKIAQVIENPRPFVEARHFVGPDRRRRAPSGRDNERRTPKEELEGKAIRNGDMTIYEVDGYKVIVHDADYTLKKMLGDDGSAWNVLNDENIRRAQQAINAAKGDFRQWVTVDVAQLEEAYAALAVNPGNKEARKQLQELALSIKSQSGTFAYDLASEVGKSLYNFVRAQPSLSQAQLLVIRKHIDILYVIFHQQIEGRGQQLGDEVMMSLMLLTEKFQTSLDE